ncbi:T9SS type A sorting domain-containing protein, partial [Thalassobellus citreus]|uniref:T9SS type A sorting domain-containing protein n=1 Tax=Thalassobellus citreus TaxID=3367752 RepID=UPI0037A2ACE4
DGCTADLVLNLTVTPKPADIVTNATICSGETYTWTAGNGNDYTTNQSGVRVTNDGCTADLVLNLTVKELNIYYLDNDGDGYGSTISAMLCDLTTPLGYSNNNTDCNDSDANINPGKTEIPGNGIDDDCNPATLDGTLEIDKFSLANIVISPNPFNDIINIKLPLSFNNSELNIKIFDMNGRLVLDRNHTSINNYININDLDKLEQAPYLFKIIDLKTGATARKRLIKH